MSNKPARQTTSHRRGTPAEVEITSRDFWCKIVEFLQQNWALIEPGENGVEVCFIDDASGVFDHMSFSDQGTAEAALGRNGFSKVADDPVFSLRQAPRPPAPPYFRTTHDNGPIYSSGRFWL